MKQQLRNRPGKYYDQHGLVLRVAPGGSKQWVRRGTIRGRRRDIGLGSVDYTTLAEARDIAYEYRRLARSGLDPTTFRRNACPTFAEATERVIDTHRRGWKEGGKSEENWRSSLQRYAYPTSAPWPAAPASTPSTRLRLPYIGSMPVDEITSADLVRVLLPIWHEKRETARKVKTRMGVVIRWSIV